MAVVQLQSGDSLTVGGTTEVYGTTGLQTLTVLDNSNITFRSGFNNGTRDTINLSGLAQNFDVSIVNGNAVLTSAVDGITINIPVGANGANIVFDGGDSRVLVVTGSTYTFGAQTITPNAAPIDVTPGIGNYTVTPDAVQHLEGTAYTFTVTRTDTTIANEQLTFNVQGDTNGGTVTAALPGVDFTAAGNTVTFLGNSKTATFTVNLNLDSNVEGLEGILAQVFKSGNVVASATGLIEDANKVGQTFNLTTGIDTVGSGTQSDLVGSEGSTSTIGQDTIVVTENTANVFDDIDGGDDRDLLRILDAGSGGFGGAPDFTNIKIANVEDATYTSVRGLDSGELDTSGWTGLETFVGQVDSGADQTFIFSTEMTNITLTNAGTGDVQVEGGSGVLTVNADAPGDVEVGQDGSDNAFTDVFVNGGDDVDITDTSADQTLTNVQLNGFEGTGGGETVTLTGDNIATVGIRNLVNGTRFVDIFANNPTVTISDISVTALDVTASGAATFVIGDEVFGLDDLSSDNGSFTTVNYVGAGGVTFGDLNVTDSSGDAAADAEINNKSSDGGTLTFDDINGDSPSNDLRIVTINATNGNVVFDDFVGSTYGPFDGPVTLNITGAGDVSFDTLTGAAPNGSLITRTGSGDTTIGDLTTDGPYRTALSTTTQFTGSTDTGSDTMTFEAGNERANTFGGGDDNIALLGSLGVGGSLDAGVGGLDKLFMEANNLDAFTAGVTATSNFNELVITHQVDGADDVINLQNIGFEGTTTNVTSGVGPGAPTQEVTTITITGEATWTDTVKFSGQFAGLSDIVLSDKDDASTIANLIAAEIDGSPLYTATANGGVITVTAENGGPIDDIAAGDISFTDATTPGTPGLEAGSPSYSILLGGDNTGVLPVAAVPEIFRLTLTSAVVLNGETITIDGGADDFTFTAPADLSHVGGELATFIKQAADADASWSAIWDTTIDGNDVVFTSKNGNESSPVLSGTGLTGADNYSFAQEQDGEDEIVADFEVFNIAFDTITTGNDTVTFDGETIVFSDGATLDQMAAEFVAQYGTAGVGPNWTVTLVPNGLGADLVRFTANTPGPRADLTAAAFVFVDDNNVGTPAAAISVDTQGTNGSITLNGFKNGSTLTLTENSSLVDSTGLGATHIVNLLGGTDTAANTINLVLDSDGDHGIVQASLFENVNINTADNSLGGTDTLQLDDTAVKSIVITGNDGLTLETDSTVISNLDASALGSDAFLTWTADANTVNISIKTGAGGSDIDVSAIHLPNGTPGVAANPIQFVGGAGNDELQLGTTAGSARANITLGGGNDLVHVGLQDGGNDYSNINDFVESTGSTSWDQLDFDGITGGLDTDILDFRGQDDALEATAVFQDYLDQAAGNNADDGGATGDIHFFVWTDGNTYVVRDNDASDEFVDGVDQVIRLTGIHDLTVDNFA
jgi:hypothetical protein